MNEFRSRSDSVTAFLQQAAPESSSEYNAPVVVPEGPAEGEAGTPAASEKSGHSRESSIVTSEGGDEEGKVEDSRQQVHDGRDVAPVFSLQFQPPGSEVAESDITVATASTAVATTPEKATKEEPDPTASASYVVLWLISFASSLFQIYGLLICYLVIGLVAVLSTSIIDLAYVCCRCFAAILLTSLPTAISYSFSCAWYYINSLREREWSSARYGSL